MRVGAVWPERGSRLRLSRQALLASADGSLQPAGSARPGAVRPEACAAYAYPGPSASSAIESPFRCACKVESAASAAYASCR